MTTSIQRRLTFTVLVGVIAVAAATGAMLYVYVRAALLRQFDQSLTSKARALAMLVERSREGKLDFDFVPAAMPEFTSPASGEFFQLRREDGITFARSPSLRAGELPSTGGLADDAIEDVTLPDGRAGRSIGLRFTPRQEVDDDGRPLPAPGPAPTLLLALARDRGEVDRPLRALASSLLGAALALAVGATAIVGWAVRRGLRPLRGVADRAARIDADTLDDRFPAEEMPSELRPIALRLNDLLARLQASFHRERRFTADVAHELRTPIAELRAMAEVALRWPEDATAASGQQHARDTLAIARQMEAVVGTLLALSRCHAGALAAAARPGVDVAQLVREAWQPLRGAAEERGLEIEMDLPPVAETSTDPALFSAILANLFSNAVRYTPTRGSVRCAVVTSNREGFAVTVENANGDLRPEDLPHLFEPFWRKDTARTDGSHCGLGLTLVGAYARLLGLRVDAALPASDRFRIRIVKGDLGAVHGCANGSAGGAVAGMA